MPWGPTLCSSESRLCRPPPPPRPLLCSGPVEPAHGTVHRRMHIHIGIHVYPKQPSAPPACLPQYVLCRLPAPPLPVTLCAPSPFPTPPSRAAAADINLTSSGYIASFCFLRFVARTPPARASRAGFPPRSTIAEPGPTKRTPRNFRHPPAALRLEPAQRRSL